MSRVTDMRRIVQDTLETDTPLASNRAFEAGVEGYSGDRLIGLLQRMAAYFQDDPQAEHLAYLEIGVFRGLTLSNVAVAAPRLKIYGCDNFSQFDPSGVNKSVVLGHLEKLGVTANVTLIEADFEPVLADGDGTIEGRKLGVYFFDGPHDYRSQIIGLMWGTRFLCPGGVMVIDDCNWQQVRQATYDFLKGNPDYALLLEVYTPRHPKLGNPEYEQECKRTWWNGLNVIVHDPDHELERRFPEYSTATRDFHLSLHPTNQLLGGGYPTKVADVAQGGGNGA